MDADIALDSSAHASLGFSLYFSCVGCGVDVGFFRRRRKPERALQVALSCSAHVRSTFAALLLDAPIPGDDNEHPMTLEKRKELFSATVHFFLNPKPSVCSLDTICDALERDADRIRSGCAKR